MYHYTIEPEKVSQTYSFITVSKLLESEIFINAEIISTNKGLKNKVKSATIMDVNNILDWIHEDEILIIGVFIHSSFTLDFIRKLKNIKVPCIITKKRFATFVSREKIELLKKLDIPLVFIEDHFSWSDIIIALQNTIIKEQTNSLIRTENFYTQIINWFRNNLSVESICQEFYRLTNYSMAIIDKNFQIIDHSYDLDWFSLATFISENIMDKIDYLGKKLNGIPTKGYIIDIGYIDAHLTIIPSNTITTTDFYFVLYTNAENKILPPEILSKIDILKQLYMYQIDLKQENAKSNIYFRNFILSSVFLTEVPDENLKSKFSLLLNTPLNEPYYLLKIISKTQSNKIINDIDSLSNFLEDVQWTLNNNLFFVYDDSWIILTNKDKIAGIDISEYILNNLSSYFTDEDFLVALSNEHYFFNLQTAYKEASITIEFMKNNIKTKKSIMRYSDLGLIQLFLDKDKTIDDIYIQNIYNSYLKPLCEYDQNHNSNLMETLECFYKHNLSFKETSETLFIHVNTLRTRLKKIESLLEVNIKDVNAIMNIQIAFYLYRIKD